MTSPLAPDLAGKVAIVTGASSGFGARFARTLADNGAQVIAAARRLERLQVLAEASARIHAVRCDVADDDDLVALVRHAVDHLGSVDIVVNNAGISDAPEKAESEDPSAFRRVVQINLNACFVLASKAAAEMIKAERGGSIINIASVHGFVGSAPNTQAAYIASKGGLVALTKELALQWARYNIRVNSIAPGYFATELTEGLIGEGNESGQKWVNRNTPMRRPGELHELDGPLLLLASNAGSYITGHTLTVDGGWLAR